MISHKKNCIIVGSGPAALACAQALIDRGESVSILDIGRELPVEKRHALTRLKNLKCEHWEPSDIIAIKNPMNRMVAGTPVKTAYGSDYAYAELNADYIIEKEGVQALPSHAKNGFASVWGANMLPFLKEDISDWPTESQKLDLHYKAVLRHVPLSAKADGLTSRFPMYGKPVGFLEPTRQANAIYDALSSRCKDMENQGVTYGYARAAVFDRADEKTCAYCGLCLHGCPYGLIFDGSQWLGALQKTGLLVYQKNRMVVRFVENSHGVVVQGLDLSTGKNFEEHGKALFIGAGVYGTAKIVLESSGQYGKELVASDCMRFLSPWITKQAFKKETQEKHHALAQLFIEVNDANISRNTVHLQIYGYNDMYESALKGLKYIFGANQWLAARMITVMGYLHSSESDKIKISISKGINGTSVLRLKKSDNQFVNPFLKNLKKKLQLLSSASDCVSVPYSFKIMPAGQSYHTGGTLPMKEKPSEYQTDFIGKLHGMDKTYIIDSSVMPSIPATTVTLPLMANAHRIGSLAHI